MNAKMLQLMRENRIKDYPRIIQVLNIIIHKVDFFQQDASSTETMVYISIAIHRAPVSVQEDILIRKRYASKVFQISFLDSRMISEKLYQSKMASTHLISNSYHY